jgi:hypothetical protein
MDCLKYSSFRMIMKPDLKLSLIILHKTSRQGTIILDLKTGSLLLRIRSINSQHLDYNAFQKACVIARENWIMSLQSHEALVTSFENAQGETYPHDKGPNTVATKSFWTFEEKATGKKTRRETVIIIITRLEEDKVRRVTQWTEVTRDLE